VLCLFIGYPFAYFMARARPRAPAGAADAGDAAVLDQLPAACVRLEGPAVRSTAGWPTAIIGLGLDQLLLAAGVISAPGKLMHTPFSLVLGMTYTYLPFMILPLYGNLAKMDLRLLEAAADLGATPWVAFWKVTVPLSKAGIIAGSMLVFIPCVGEFVIPELLGGPRDADDRPRAVGRVLQQQRLADGQRGGGGDGAADHRAAGHLQQVPGRSTGARQ
jgi:putrescine transport system permease protein